MLLFPEPFVLLWQQQTMWSPREEGRAMRGQSVNSTRLLMEGCQQQAGGC